MKWDDGSPAIGVHGRRGEDPLLPPRGREEKKVFLQESASCSGGLLLAVYE